MKCVVLVIIVQISCQHSGTTLGTLRGGPLDILGGGCQIQKKIHARN